MQLNISIITINFNNGNGLRKTIESVISQSFQPFEYLVIDGGSSDGSKQVIMDYKDKISLWISENDKGIYDAMNKGICRASGNYLMFLNSGDILADDRILEIRYNKIRDNPSTDIFYGDIWGTNGDGKKKWVHKHPPQLDILFFQRKNINHQSSLIRKSLFEEFGPYPLYYKFASDHWLFLKSFLQNKVFTHIDYPLVVYDYSGTSSINGRKYNSEMDLMWMKEVPEYTRDVIEKYWDLFYKGNGRLVKLALKAHTLFNDFKNLLKR